MTIAVQLADGAAVPQLIVGDQTPIGFKAYVQKEGDPKLYLSTGAFHSGIKKELKDLRDKTIIDFNNDQIQTIELLKAGKTFRVAAGDSNFVAQVPRSGGWWTYKRRVFGALDLQAGVVDLTVAPATEPKRWGSSTAACTAPRRGRCASATSGRAPRTLRRSRVMQTACSRWAT